MLKMDVAGNSRLKTLSNFFLAAVLPLLFTGWWVWKNTQLPTADAATFLTNVGDIYNQFLQHGVIAGFKSAYVVRAWRPVILPLFAVPGMFLSGNILFAVKSVALLSVMLTAIFSYLFMRLVLDRPSAIVAANLIGLLPLIQEQLLTFYAESLLFPCLIAALYFLIRSDYFRDMKASAAFVAFFSLAVMLRPIEAIIHLSLVLSLFLGMGWKQGVFTSQQLRLTISIGIWAVFAFFLCAIAPALHFKSIYITDAAMRSMLAAMVGGTAVMALLCLVMMNIKSLWSQGHSLQQRIRNGERPTLLVPMMLSSMLLVIIWYAPAALETIQWLYLTSFGSVAQTTVTTKSQNGALWGELSLHINAEGRGVLLSLSGLTLFALCIQGKKMFRILSSMPFLFAFLLVPLPLCEIIFTVQDILRKMSVASPGLIMALLIVCLWPGRWQRLRLSAVIAITLFELTGLWWTVFIDPTHATINMEQSIGYYLSHPITTSPNPHNVVQDFLTQAAKKYGFKAVALEVDPNLINPIDPFLMSAMIAISKPGYSAGINYFAEYKEENAKRMIESNDSILISDSVNRMIVSPKAAADYKVIVENDIRPTNKTIYQLLYYYASNRLAELGWTVSDCFVIHAACEGGHADCNACLLLPVKHAT